MKMLILGGDLKNYYLYKKMLKQGLNVSLSGFDHLPGRTRKKPPVFSRFDIIITPVPLTIDGATLYSPFSEDVVHIQDLMTKAADNARIIGGPFNFKDKRLWDITKEESFIDLNVIPTCEEIIKILIEKSHFTVMGSCITLYGYGKISQRLSHLLEIMGSYIHIKSNKEDIDRPNSPLNSEDNLENSDIVIATSSKIKINRNMINLLSPGTIIIDVASVDGCIDYKYAMRRNIEVIKARGLPGKSAPLTVSEYIFNTLKRNNLISIDNK